ncbi:MAG: hypothetical protein ACRDXX_11230 [Stackebrandtia sp.]
MESQEFFRLLDEIVDRLAPKASPQTERFVREEVDAGEPGVAVAELTAALANQSVPVTPADRDNLRLLLAELGESTEDVERLNVVETPES